MTMTRINVRMFALLAALAVLCTNGLRIQLNKERNRHPGHYILIADLVDHYVQTSADRTFSGNGSALSRYANCVDYRRVTST